MLCRKSVYPPPPPTHTHTHTPALKSAGDRVIDSSTHKYRTYVALNDVTLLADAWLYGVHGTCAETSIVSRSTNHVTTKQRCKHTASVDIQKTPCVKLQSLTHLESHTTKTRWICSDRKHRTALSNCIVKRLGAHFEMRCWTGVH